MSDAAAPEKKKSGRKVETPAERLARLERDIVTARKAVSEAEREKLSVVGGAVLAEAAENEAFRDQLHALLKARVTGKGKAAIAGLFG